MTFSFATIDISVFNLTPTIQLRKKNDKLKETRKKKRREKKDTYMCSIMMNVLFSLVCGADSI